MRLSRRKNRQKPVLSLARTGRLHALDILESHVHQPPFPAVHGRKSIRNPAPDHLVRCRLGLQPQLLRLQRLEVGRVKANQVVFPLVQPQHLRRNGLQCAQKFAVMLRNQRHIRPAEFHINLASFNALWVARAVSRGDAVFQAQASEFIEGDKESSYLLCGLLQVVDWHNKPVSQSQPRCAP